MVIGLMAGLLLGHVIDSCRITPMLLLCFLLRGVGLFMMTLGISDFAEQKAMLYCSIFAMTTGTFCQTIVVQSLLNKRLIAPTREIMNGMSQAMRALGVMTVTGLGSVVAKANVNAPFLLVGCFDMAFVLAILVLVGLRKLTV
uniref:Major facilitator superfamily (MFS) profile domain-containing protein n=1 Tax=Favella ehrenbergii TaxID=182087 RepID=A0A7S3I9L0_9SPIT|mmetsp:Transcript_37106/g.48768  ORF Transcript_37106/g.48768 Transcript_37106/m.48768 type:complete len:143 (+) Transcript_37106:1294-1722(+)